MFLVKSHRKASDLSNRDSEGEAERSDASGFCPEVFSSPTAKIYHLLASQ